MANSKALPVTILVAIIFGVGIWSYSALEKNSDSGMFKRAKAENTFDGYVSYITEYPNGKHSKEAGDAICQIIGNTPLENLSDIASTVNRKIPKTGPRERCQSAVEQAADKAYSKALRENTVESWNHFIKYVPKDYIKDANTKMVDAAYAEATKTNTIAGWNHFKSVVGFTNYRDADQRIENLEAKQWRNESNAWRLASEEGTIAAYNKYLKFHPSGSHAATARKKVIDLEVDGIFAGSHGTLPSMDRTYYGYSSTSSVTIHNGTGYTLTIYYSGNSSKKVSIPAGQTTSFSMPNGEYRVAASVSSASVRSYAGRESLIGGGYEADYYISTSRF